MEAEALEPFDSIPVLDELRSATELRFNSKMSISIYLSIYLYLHVFLSFFLSIYLSINQSTHLSIYLSIGSTIVWYGMVDLRFICV